MAYEMKNGQGSLFKNDKEGNDARPDYTGKLMVDGQLYRVAGWIKASGRSGEKYMSLHAEAFTERPARPANEPTNNPVAEGDGGEDIPF